MKGVMKCNVYWSKNMDVNAVHTYCTFHGLQLNKCMLIVPDAIWVN